MSNVLSGLQERWQGPISQSALIIWQLEKEVDKMQYKIQKADGGNEFEPGNGSEAAKQEELLVLWSNLQNVV